VHEQFRDLSRAAARSRAHRRYSCSVLRWAKRREASRGVARSAERTLGARERAVTRAKRKEHRRTARAHAIPLFFCTCCSSSSNPDCSHTSTWPFRALFSPLPILSPFIARSAEASGKKRRNRDHRLAVDDNKRWGRRAPRDNAERALLLAILHACLGRAKKCQRAKESRAVTCVRSFFIPVAQQRRRRWRWDRAR